MLQILDISGTAHVTDVDIANAVSNYLGGNLDINRQAGGSCDGASVMLGKHQGAMVNIKRKAPSMVVTHCAVHRLSLAACNTSSFTWFSMFEKTLHTVYSFFLTKYCTHS